jgi:hypothetical protein
MRKLNEFGLTQAQEIFLQEYIKCANGYKSYLVAYPNSKNWKRASVDRKVSDLLNNDKIQARITEHNQKVNSALEKSTILNKRKILNEIIELQQGIKADKGQTNVNLQALKLLSQIAGMLQENKTEVNINNNNNIAVQNVSEFLDL